MINKMDLNNKALSIRKKIGEDDSSPIDIFALAQNIPNLTLIFYPLGNNISGACLRKDTSVLIALNSEMSIGRQRFTLAHELYHYYFDLDNTSIICSFTIEADNEIERNADLFASYLLIPSSALYEKIQTFKESGVNHLTVSEIVKLEQYFGMSRKAMLKRLLEEKEITMNEFIEFQQDIILTASKLGYDVSLYKPTLEHRNKFVLGHYITQAEKLLQMDRISNGKYEELLLEAYRDDIVYGNDSGEFID